MPRVHPLDIFRLHFKHSVFNGPVHQPGFPVIDSIHLYEISNELRDCVFENLILYLRCSLYSKHFLGARQEYNLTLRSHKVRKCYGRKSYVRSLRFVSIARARHRNCSLMANFETVSSRALAKDHCHPLVGTDFSIYLNLERIKQNVVAYHTSPLSRGIKYVQIGPA